MEMPLDAQMLAEKAILYEPRNAVLKRGRHIRDTNVGEDLSIEVDKPVRNDQIAEPPKASEVAVEGRRDQGSVIARHQLPKHLCCTVGRMEAIRHGVAVDDVGTAFADPRDNVLSPSSGEQVVDGNVLGPGSDENGGIPGEVDIVEPRVENARTLEADIPHFQLLTEPHGPWLNNQDRFREATCRTEVRPRAQHDIAGDDDVPRVYGHAAALEKMKTDRRPAQAGRVPNVRSRGYS